MCRHHSSGCQLIFITPESRAAPPIPLPPQYLSAPRVFPLTRMITCNSIAAQSESTVNSHSQAANAGFINLSGGINICFMRDL